MAKAWHPKHQASCSGYFYCIIEFLISRNHGYLWLHGSQLTRLKSFNQLGHLRGKTSRSPTYCSRHRLSSISIALREANPTVGMRLAGERWRCLGTFRAVRLFVYTGGVCKHSQKIRQAVERVSLRRCRAITGASRTTKPCQPPFFVL